MEEEAKPKPFQSLQQAQQQQRAAQDLQGSYKKLIQLQQSAGFWTSSAHHLLLSLMPKPFPNSSLPEDQLFTIAALCLLEERFPEKQPEWQLIAQKAK